MDIVAKINIQNTKKVTSISDIKEGCKLFYELGYYRVDTKFRDTKGFIHEKKTWIRTGVFQEIKNIKEFLIYAESDFEDEEYINHHNFVIVDNGSKICI